jgi:signal transduction histidine kinase
MEADRMSREVENLATELERTRIAQEIHDSLGHTLTSLNIQLEVARKFSERDQKRSFEALELAKQLASQSLTDVRTAIQSIRHPDFDLKEAVNTLAKQIRQSQTLEVNVNIEDSEISTTIAYQLFRIIQECLTNVMKHAQASEVSVVLTRDAKRIELVVSDNGNGLATQGKSQGFGIRGMQERVESMHGTVNLQSQPGKGTSLQVSIPL